MSYGGNRDGGAPRGGDREGGRGGDREGGRGGSPKKTSTLFSLQFSKVIISALRKVMSGCVALGRRMVA